MHRGDHERAQRIARLTRSTQTEASLRPKLEAVTALARRTIAGCDAAGISLLVEGRTASVAASDRIVIEVDLVQYRTDEGPCLAAIGTGAPVRIDVVERNIRFPRFAPGAIDIGINSVQSVPLLVDGTSIGALNLYSRSANAFDDSTVEEAQPYADYAADLIAASPLYAYSLDLLEALTDDLEERAVLSQATGLIMAAESVTEPAAVEIIRTVALAEERSLRDVAEQITRERRIPRPDPGT